MWPTCAILTSRVVKKKKGNTCCIDHFIAPSSEKRLDPPPPLPLPGATIVISLVSIHHFLTILPRHFFPAFPRTTAHPFAKPFSLTLLPLSFHVRPVHKHNNRDTGGDQKRERKKIMTKRYKKCDISLRAETASGEYP